jgi:SAM-dependent methyltransferase
VSHLDVHNRFQCDYFEGPPKKTMVPAVSPYLEQHVTRAIDAAELKPSDRVLEVGCGMGRYTLPLAARGVRVEGHDLSQILLDRLRGYAGGRYDIPLHCGDILRPPAAFRGAFDVVMGFFVLHHIHTLGPTFSAMATLLKPGGRLVFVEPNPFNPLYYVQIAVTPGMKWQAERGMTRMRRRVIFDACRRAGLTGCELSRFGFFPPFIANRPWGGACERVLEQVPLWRGALPTQLFKARRP